MKESPAPKWAFLLTIVLMTTPPVSAISATTPDAASTQTSPAIAACAAASDDPDIAVRIRNTFEQIQSLQDVSVRVSSGVVTLSERFRRRMIADVPRRSRPGLQAW